MALGKVFYVVTVALGVVGSAIWFGAPVARAEGSCPLGSWATAGSCCEVGNEFVLAKQACLPVRPERRCVVGHLDDCVSAARTLEVRNSVGAGYALELYRYACEEGYAPGCRGLGTLYERGNGVERDEKRALTLWESACTHGDAPACTLLARGLVRDGGADARVLPLLVIGCHRGDADACAEYAERLAHDGAQYARAQSYFERACVGGAARACRALLEQERRDDTLVRTRERDLLERGCQAADATSCNELADAISRVDHSDTGLAAAAGHYRSACDGGNATACLSLAELTLDGRGVHRDVDQANDLYARACGAGNTLACERKHNLDDGDHVSRIAAPHGSSPLTARP